MNYFKKEPKPQTKPLFTEDIMTTRDIAKFYLASIPSVVSGKDHIIEHVFGTSSIVMPFTTVDGSFVVDVCVSDNTSD
jgi:CheY-specific phosphatase CheX